MKKILTLTIIILSSCFTASASGILRYQVLKPASHPLPKDVRTLAFVFQNITFAADSITKRYTYNEEIFVDTTNYRRDIAEAAYMGFRSVMDEHYTLDTIPLIVLDEKQGNTDRTIPPMSWTKVNELCKQNNSDILVSLDDIVIFNNYETWYDGAEHNGIADISSFHTWTIYDPLTESLLLHEKDLDSLQAHETDYSLDRLIKNKLPHRAEIMKVVAFSIGENLAKQLAPRWETIYREYYNGGNKEMREAAAKVREEKWEEALKIWAAMKMETADKYGARAAFNSAIIHERIGQIENALVDIQQSVNIYKTLNRYSKEKELAEVLQKVLGERKSEVAELKAQQAE